MSIGHPSLAREYHPCVADKKKVLIPPYPFLPGRVIQDQYAKIPISNVPPTLQLDTWLCYFWQ